MGIDLFLMQLEARLDYKVSLLRDDNKLFKYRKVIGKLSKVGTSEG